MGVYKESVVVTGDAADYERAMKKASGTTKTATKSWVDNFKGVATAVKAFMAIQAVRYIYAFGKSLVDAAVQADEAQAKLANSIRNSKDVTAASIPVFNAQADALRNLTGADDEAINGAQALLVQMGLTQDQIASLIPLIVDVSAKMNIDLNTATKAVGKAVNGTVAGLTRMGIVVDKNAAKTDAYGATLKALGVVQGFAADRAKAEPWRILSAQFDEMKETLGKELLPVLQELVPVLTDLLPAVIPVGEALLAFGGLAFLPALLSHIAEGLGAIAVALESDALVALAAGLSAISAAAAPAAAAAVGYGIAFAGADAKVQDAQASLEKLGVSTEGMGVMQIAAVYHAKALTGAFDEQSVAVMQQKAAIDAYINGVDGAANAQDRLSLKTREANKALHEQKAALLDLAGGTLGIIAAMQSASQAEDEVNKLRRQGKLDTQDGTDAIMAATQAQLDLIQKVKDYGAELKKSGDTQAQVRDKLQELAAEMGITSKEFHDAFPNISGVAGALDRINRMPRHFAFSADFSSKIASGNFTPGVATGGILKAANGMIARGPTYLVGEGGYPTFAGRGAEAVIPLDGRGISILAEAVRRGMGSDRGSDRLLQALEGAVAHEHPITIDGYQVARALDRRGVRRGGAR